MSVQTTYNDLRDSLRDDMKECLNKAIEMLNPDIWGHSEMRTNYAEKLYKAIKDAYNKI